MIEPVAIAAPVGGAVTWRTIVVGAYHACGITTGDALYCWGNNDSGQVGDQTTTNRSVPTQPYRAWAVSWASVAPGANHTCATTTGGTLYCWGQGSYSKTLVGSQTAPTVVTRVELVSAKSVASGPEHTCFIVANDAIWCSGWGYYGELGNGSTYGYGLYAVTGNRTWAAVAAGDNYTCGILSTSATLYCWGANGSGQLGDGTTYQRNSPIAPSGEAPTYVPSTTPTSTKTPTATTVPTRTLTPTRTIAPTATSTPTLGTIASGKSHACALTSRGEAYCWGDGNDGKLGNGGVGGSQSQPQRVSSSVAYSSLVLGANHACALDASGAAWCWGRNSQGQLGNTSVGSYAPTPVQVAGTSTWRSLVAGYAHTCAVATDGAAWCWGAGASGQLGNGQQTNVAATPVAVSGGRTWVALAAGYSHTCGIASNERAYCWGDNPDGQLGDGTTYTTRTTPVEVGGNKRWKAIAAGDSHTCALTTDGAAWCWGFNAYGQVGDGTSGVGTTDADRSLPVEVSPGTTWASITAGYMTSCAVATDGTASCWGQNGRGQLGNGVDYADRSTPMAVAGHRTWANLSAGDAFTCGTTLSGVGMCWGANQTGQLGDGMTIDRDVPAAISVSAWAPLPPIAEMPLTWATISAGANHTCAITPSSKAYCWGSAGNGELGNGSNDARQTPWEVSGGYSWADVSAGNSYTCGVLTSGDGYCWGSGWNAQLGLGNWCCWSNTPQRVATPSGATGVSWARIVTSPIGYHTCGITTGKALYCWGENGNGQLGNGSYNRGYSPTAVTSPVTAGVEWAAVSLGNMHTCGLTTTGAAYCWGNGGSGQLGTSDTTGVAVPTALSRGWTYKWQSIGAGVDHTCGVTTAGKAYCWGANSFGQVGDGTTVATSVPIPVTSATSFASITAGSQYACARTSAGEAWCWGRNHTGQLGDGAGGQLQWWPYTEVQSSSPVQVIADVSLSQISAGSAHTCAIGAGQSAWCWGTNGSGQLGVPSLFGSRSLIPVSLSGMVPTATPTASTTATRSAQVRATEYAANQTATATPTVSATPTATAVSTSTPTETSTATTGPGYPTQTRTSTNTPTSTPTVPAGGIVTSFTPQTVTLARGKTQPETVSVVLGPGMNFKTGNFTLSYDTTKIQVLSCNVISANVTGTCSAGVGTKSVTLTSVKAAGATGSVQILSLNLLGLAAGQTSIDFTNLSFTSAAGGALTVSATLSLNLTILEPTPTPTVTSIVTNTPTETPTSTPTIAPAETNTPTATSTPTSTATSTPTSTAVSSPTSTSTATLEPTPTMTVASPGEVRFVTVVNVTDSAFTVIWATINQVSGAVSYSQSGGVPSTVAYDVRGTGVSDVVHFVTVRGLVPSTRYAFDIVSGNATDDNGGGHYGVTTGPTLALVAPDSIAGSTVISATGDPPATAIVFMTARSAAFDSAPIGTLIGADDAGFFNMNLGSMRMADRQSAFVYDDATVLTFTAFAGAQAIGRATSTVAQARDVLAPIQIGPTISVTITLNAGWNLVALPLSPVATITAPNVCAAINASTGAGTAIEIDKFVDGGWVGHRCGIPPNAYSLIAGQGYFVRVSKPTTWTVDGLPHDGKATHALQAGWNLIGLPGLAGRLDAPSVLTSINSAASATGSGYAATEMDRWQSGGWEGHLRGLPLNKFGIEESRGYFVKLTRPVTWAVPGTVAMNRVQAQVTASGP